MDLPVLESRAVTAPDGVNILLRRYRGGDKGPVVVVHGAGVWSGMFALPTVKENFLQFLVANGYDTWLLDWRASIKLPLTQFTFDQAAENDFPAAVRVILGETRADSLQAVVHCAGSGTFFMALAAGLLPQVRCVSCSQVALHYQAPAPTDIKCALNLDAVLSAAGVQYLSATDDPDNPVFQEAFSELSDALDKECSSRVCHRLTFMYGHLYRHEKLGAETHDRLAEQFGKCNMTAFRHLAQLVRAGVARRFDHGPDENQRRYGSLAPPTYLQSEHLKLPITFVSGELNQTFLPASTQSTYEWLCRENGSALYKRHVVPGYGHIDNFMGSQAATDCYPLFLEQLEACPA